MNIRITGVIAKPVSQVFETLFEIQNIHCYCTSNSGDVDLPEQKMAQWNFMGAQKDVPVALQKIEKNKEFVFDWTVNNISTTVSIELRSTTDRRTFMIITERSFELAPDGEEHVLNKIQYWTDFFGCLNAYIAPGVDIQPNAVSQFLIDAK